MGLRKRIFASAGIIVSAACVATALAATTTVDDPAGDVSGSPSGATTKHDVDITGASAGMSGNKVKLTIHVKGSIDAALKRVETSPGFAFKRPRHPQAFDVFGTANNGYTAENYTGNSVPANLNVTSEHSASITFNPAPIGLPNNYRWYAVTGVCQPFDRAPDSGWAEGQISKRC